MRTILALIALVLPAAATAQEEAGASLRSVTWERLLNAADEPENWLMYSGTLDSQRFSGLEQIHNRNVGNLEAEVGVSDTRDRPGGGPRRSSSTA